MTGTLVSSRLSMCPLLALTISSNHRLSNIFIHLQHHCTLNHDMIQVWVQLKVHILDHHAVGLAGILFPSTDMCLGYQ